MRTRISTVLTTLATAATITAVTAPGAAAAPEPVTFTAVLGTFESDLQGGTAVTYDTALVPRGGVAGVSSLTSPARGTVTELTVRGLLPDRQYGAHVHVNPCGATGEAAGPHYQHVPDPEQPSTDPAYANPENEIWLDLTTDSEGAGKSRSEVAWTFGERKPASVVIHERHTATGEGEAGAAGARLACVDVDF
ncbi:superoxide dismutase family protein [Saccharomonospora piscinae]|uniref:superoxide dismutase family protein n=1 Tax=Saccharomonospora piscinae TaxID=687388 RepID=UPI001106BC31|nr:superoxide dismutase family protein [Saccharomonospora piscinae]TLW93171.1 superoxide dismutase family protein [Saccharomonospora piscinae]